MIAAPGYIIGKKITKYLDGFYTIKNKYNLTPKNIVIYGVKELLKQGREFNVSSDARKELNKIKDKYNIEINVTPDNFKGFKMDALIVDSVPILFLYDDQKELIEIEFFDKKDSQCKHLNAIHFVKLIKFTNKYYEENIKK